MSELRVIIAGGRDFDDYKLLEKTMTELDFNIKCIISGTADGADTLGELWAEEHQIPIKRFPPKWNVYRRRAGPVRNEQMAVYGDYLIAFWDGKSKGTKNMINTMKRKGKHGRVIFYENNL